MMSGVLSRVCLAAVALLLVAWLGVLLRNAVVADSAGDRIFHAHELDAVQLDREFERLEGARLLDPDTGVEDRRASLLWLRGRVRQSARVAAALAREEPDNVQAWVHLYRATREADPRQAARALAQIRRLNPLGASRAPRLVSGGRGPAAGPPPGLPGRRPPPAAPPGRR
jgi:hypothetical protein